MNHRNPFQQIRAALAEQPDMESVITILENQSQRQAQLLEKSELRAGWTLKDMGSVGLLVKEALHHLSQMDAPADPLAAEHYRHLTRCLQSALRQAQPAIQDSTRLYNQPISSLEQLALVLADTDHDNYDRVLALFAAPPGGEAVITLRTLIGDRAVELEHGKALHRIVVGLKRQQQPIILNGAGITEFSAVFWAALVGDVQADISTVGLSKKDEALFRRVRRSAKDFPWKDYTGKLNAALREIAMRAEQ